MMIRFLSQAVDYPPNANAGDDVLITLPENSINLYANASSDDKGIASYEWKPKTEGFSADVEVRLSSSSQLAREGHSNGCNIKLL